MKENFQMQIRPELPADVSAIHALNSAAFETRVEADLVDAVRNAATPIVSLVADKAGETVGHILFSPVTLSGHPDAKIMGLAPMAVLPTEQKSGVGTALVNAGIEDCRKLGYGAIVVLGHAQYYPRFGFKPASHFGIKSEYEVPDDVFMAMELVPGYLNAQAGTIQYHPAFANL